MMKLIRHTRAASAREKRPDLKTRVEFRKPQRGR